MSLIELLIILALSSIVVQALYTAYLQMKEYHFYHVARQELVEETRFIHFFIERAIQGSGYMGFSSWKKIEIYDDISQCFLANDRIIWNASNNELPGNLKKKIKSNTQAIELRQMDFCVTGMVVSSAPGETKITIESNDTAHLKEGNYVVIANRLYAEINKIQSIKKTLFNWIGHCIMPMRKVIMLGNIGIKYISSVTQEEYTLIKTLFMGFICTVRMG